MQNNAGVTEEWKWWQLAKPEPKPPKVVIDTIIRYEIGIEGPPDDVFALGVRAPTQAYLRGPTETHIEISALTKVGLPRGENALTVEAMGKGLAAMLDVPEDMINPMSEEEVFGRPIYR